jgi:hypothetical protein
VSTFGVSGFYPARDASELVHDGTYEVIFVASLFSHLTYSHWGGLAQAALPDAG